MPRRVFIFLKKTGNSVSYLPHRQLRKSEMPRQRAASGYLPHRQLRNFSDVLQQLVLSYLPHRQLRKLQFQH